MLKAVFRPSELVTLTDKVVIESPSSYPEMAHLAPVEEIEDELSDVEEYLGPTADDLRREAELFRTHWEEEKEKMIKSAKDQAKSIVQMAQKEALDDEMRQVEKADAIKRQAEDEAQKIIAEAQSRAALLENEVRMTLENERREARDTGRQEGRDEGYAEGKAEVIRLIERTQTMLERAQNKRKDILYETEKEIVDLVLLITRKVIKVLSENQKDIIVTNTIQALRKVKSKGDVIIRVNLADLKLATEHKQEFIQLMEGNNLLSIIEDSSVDQGGCIIETDFGEIDARISSQLAELESKILDISPISSSVKANTPVPVVRTANLNADLAASSSFLNAVNNEPEKDDFDDLPPAANAALTASAALAAITAMATKGKRDSDRKVLQKIENPELRKDDPRV